MKLIDLLVKELPKRGGWPSNALSMAQDREGYCWGYKCENLTMQANGWWKSKSGDAICRGRIMIEEMASDWDSSFVTRAQYESALAASEGWIEWGGGECPVDDGVLVEVKYRNELPFHFKGTIPADQLDWSNGNVNGDIIAYRLHKPDINSRANDDRLEQDLNECIGASEDQANEWNGIGKPQVGATCQAFIFGAWTDVKVVYIGDEAGWHEALVFDVKSTKPAWADEFRPLRTEAEKAREEKRKLAISDIIHEMKLDENSHRDVGIASNLYRSIEAGNIRGVKLEVK